jgi:hypothetical protein
MCWPGNGVHGKLQDARRRIPWETIHGIGGDEMHIGLDEN